MIPPVSNPEKKAKGPRGNFLFGAALDFKKDGLRFVTETDQIFPDFSRFRFAYIRMVYLSHPDYIKHVLQTNNKNYKKGLEYEHLKPVLGSGLLTSEGDFWLRQRRLAQPAFHKDRIASFFKTMVECTDVLISEWEAKENNITIDVHSEMMHLALDIVAKTLLSTDIRNESNEVGVALSISIEEAYHRVKTLINLPLWVPVPRHLRYNKHRESLNKVVNTIIDQRRLSQEKSDDLLQMLMDAVDEDNGEKMSDKQLRDEVMTIFLAGHETTANALTWALYLLATHPEAEQKFRKEVDEVLKGEKPTLENVRELHYTQQIIHEVLRLYPPAWAIGRSAIADDNIDGYEIKKGDNILICPYRVHRCERFWDQPNDFIPERFTPEKMKEMHKFLYFPFGGGPRFCIGNNFAMMEMQIILPMLIQKFKFINPKNHTAEPEPLVTLRPKNGMPLQVAKS